MSKIDERLKTVGFKRDNVITYRFHDLVKALGEPVAGTLEIRPDPREFVKLGRQLRANDTVQVQFAPDDEPPLWLIGEIEMRGGETWIIDGRLLRELPGHLWSKPGSLTAAGKRFFDQGI